MRSITKVLNVPFDTVTMEGAVSRVIGFLEDNGAHIVCTPNPEIVMMAQEDKELMQILRAADMVVPDGIGIVWASKYSKQKLPERVAGFDLVQNIFKEIKDEEYKVYFFGGSPGVAQKAAKCMVKRYPGLNIAGIRNGYFSAKDEKEIISEIRRTQPDILLVGLGAPKQEKWMYDNLRLLKAKVVIGVGGSFDVMSGDTKRAPGVFRKLGLEWFYRLVTQPSRFKRMLKLPVFAYKVITQRNKG